MRGACAVLEPGRGVAFSLSRQTQHSGGPPAGLPSREGAAAHREWKRACVREPQAMKGVVRALLDGVKGACHLARASGGPPPCVPTHSTTHRRAVAPPSTYSDATPAALSFDADAASLVFGTRLHLPRKPVTAATATLTPTTTSWDTARVSVLLETTCVRVLSARPWHPRASGHR